MMKILVVAPEFPLINQPWMDTYLEQLIINGLDFKIFSLNKDPSLYGEKVVKLGLLEKTLTYDISKGAVFREIVKSLNLASSLKSLIKINKSKVLNNLGFFKLCLYAFHFNSIKKSFNDISIIHSHSESISYRFIVLAELLNVPLVLTFHGLPPQGVPQLSEARRKELYDYTSTVIVNTKFAKKQVEQFGCASEKIVVLPQGLPIEEFPYRPKPLLKKDEVVELLSVGRFHRDKGQHYSLLALKRLLAKGIKAHWTFVGAGPNLGWLKSLTLKYEIQKHVTFKTELSSKEILEQYHKAHIFVLASINTPGGHVETQGVVLQEAQASGCIVVATNTGGIPECLDCEKSAFLVKQQSSKEIFCAITEILDKTESWPYIQEQAREKVERDFSASVIGETMSNILTNCVFDRK